MSNDKQSWGSYKGLLGELFKKLTEEHTGESIETLLGVAGVNALDREIIANKLKYLKNHLPDPSRWETLVESIRKVILTFFLLEHCNDAYVHPKRTREIVSKIHFWLNELRDQRSSVAKRIWSHRPEGAEFDYNPAYALATHDALIEDCSKFLKSWPTHKEHHAEQSRGIAMGLEEVFEAYSIETAPPPAPNPLRRAVRDVGELCFRREISLNAAGKWISEYRKNGWIIEDSE